MNAIEKDVKQECKVYNFPEVPKEEVVEKLPKRTLTGEIKKTPNNTKPNRDKINPFTEEDVKLMVKYFRNKVDTSENDSEEIINRRNLSLFVMGVNVGLRCSDIVKLKWSDIYDKDWNFLDDKEIKPQKTSNKDKHVTLNYNEAFMQAIEYYRKYKPNVDINDYIATSRKGSYIKPDAFAEVIKKAAKDAGIKYNVCSHSMRKTFARVRYDHSDNKEETLVELMELFNHASTLVTLKYIGIRKDEIKRLYNKVNLGLDEMFD